MSIPVKQSTAVTITIGPILDADGVAVTGAVVGDLRIAKTTTSPAALNASATLTHRHTGHYSLILTASDVDTIGDATITLNKTTDAMPPKDLKVMEEAVYDSLYAVNAVALATINASIFLPAATRNIGDTRDIAFPWPVSGATITGTTHINGATSAALTGAVTELASYPAGGFWYKLAYNAADYPSAEGFTLIRLVDGGSNVRILPVGRGGINVTQVDGDAVAKAELTGGDERFVEALVGGTTNIVTSSPLVVDHIHPDGDYKVRVTYGASNPSRTSVEIIQDT